MAPPAPRTAPSTSPTPDMTPPTPCVAPSLVFHPARFADPARFTPSRASQSTTTTTPPLAHSCVEPPMYHSVAIHRDPDHVHPMVPHRSTGVLRPINRLVLTVDAALAHSLVPSFVRAALADPHWRQAMEEQYEALLAKHTWDLVRRPPNTNVVTGKWIFRHKLTSDGSIDRYKARWVLRSFTQRPRVDYDETFSFVIKFATVRTVLYLALS
jgi:hypothetical protein